MTATLDDWSERVRKQLFEYIYSRTSGSFVLCLEVVPISEVQLFNPQIVFYRPKPKIGGLLNSIWTCKGPTSRLNLKSFLTTTYIIYCVRKFNVVNSNNSVA